MKEVGSGQWAVGSKNNNCRLPTAHCRLISMTASKEVLISKAVVLDAEDLLIPERHVPEGRTTDEITRLHQAIDASIAEIVIVRDSMLQQTGKEIAGIFDVHVGMLKDKTLVKEIEGEIN